MRKNTFDYISIYRAIVICILIVTMIMVPGLFGQSGSVYAASKDENDGRVDALSYKMSLSLDTEKDSLKETVTIKVKNNTDKPLKELVLRDMTPAILKYDKSIDTDNKGKKTKVTSVRLKGSKKKLSVKYSKGKTVLRVKLGKKGTIAPGKTGSVVIKMKTDIPVRQDRFGVQKTKDGKIYALSFCFPYLADNVNGKWQLDPYFDDGESRSWDLADYSVTFKAPSKYKVAASGNSTTSNGVTKIKGKDMRDFAIVACDFMKKDSVEVKGVKVNSYYLNGGKNKAQYRKISKLVARDSIRLYTEQIGDYIYDELDMLPCLFGFGFGGMEYPGLIMNNASSFYDGAFCDPWSLSDVVSHEIGHQWFYAAVGNREYKEGWLDEGFTTYLEKDIYGLALTDSYEYLRQIDDIFPSLDDSYKNRGEIISSARKYYEGYYINVSPDKYPKDQNYGEAEYEEAYAFLSEVREKMGDEAFSKFLRDYYETYKMKRATTKAVVKLIKKYDNSEEMDEIIDFYVK